MIGVRPPRIGLSAMRGLRKRGYGLLSLLVNLEAVETGLLNSRIIEYPYIFQKLDGLERGKILDVGCTDGGNILAPTLAALGWTVYGIDIRRFKLEHPNFHFVQEDIRATSFPDGFFDCVYAASTLEHIGLAGRYGEDSNDPDGDLRAAREIRRILRPGGLFLLTVPYGRGGVVKPMERIYSRSRLAMLTDGWSVRDRAFFQIDDGGTWHEVTEEVAAQTPTPGGVAVALLELAPDGGG